MARISQNPWAIVGGALGGNIIGGLMGQQATREANEANQRLAADQMRTNERLQREFAQHGIRWKVEDAIRAGLHPLAALGAQTHSFSPVSVGGGVIPDDSMANSVRSMGQDISRAVSATRTSEEKQMAALQLASARADVEGKNLQNSLLLQQLNQMSLQKPDFPTPDGGNFIPGQGNGPLVKVKSAERTASQPGRAAQEAGWRPDVAYSRTDTGLTPMVPESLSESLEDDHIGKFMWRWRNQLLPNLGFGERPPNSQLPPGAKKWEWDFGKQEFQPRYFRDRRNELRWR